MTMRREISDAIARAVQAGLGTVRNVRTGVVDSYDRTTQTATIIPIVAEALDRDDETREYIDAPDAIDNVQVKFPSGGGYSLTWDIERGDLVDIHFRDVSHDEVDTGQTDQLHPESARRWNWRDVIAYPHDSTPHDPLPAGAVSSGGFVMTMPDGKVFKCGGASASVPVARADYVNSELEKVHAKLSGHTHTGGTLSNSGGTVTGTSGAIGTYLRNDVDSDIMFTTDDP